MNKDLYKKILHNVKYLEYKDDVNIDYQKNGKEFTFYGNRDIIYKLDIYLSLFLSITLFYIIYITFHNEGEGSNQGLRRREGPRGAMRPRR